MSLGDPVVLSYENTVLRESDVKLLTEPNWLNDNIIAFWYDYLENSVYKNFSKQLGFVCPQVVQYMKYGEKDDVEKSIKDLELDQKDYIFFPVNDCKAQIVPGGTHWSLLVFNAKGGQVFDHYDSFSGSSNLTEAKILANVLCPHLCKSAIVREMPCTQQKNSYDCGVHVICNTNGLCDKYILANPNSLIDIASTAVVLVTRKTIKDRIYSIKKSV